jgi:hypothetical protein
MIFFPFALGFLALVKGMSEDRTQYEYLFIDRYSNGNYIAFDVSHVIYRSLTRFRILVS